MGLELDQRVVAYAARLVTFGCERDSSHSNFTVTSRLSTKASITSGSWERARANCTRRSGEPQQHLRTVLVDWFVGRAHGASCKAGWVTRDCTAVESCHPARIRNNICLGNGPGHRRMPRNHHREGPRAPWLEGAEVEVDAGSLHAR